MPNKSPRKAIADYCKSCTYDSKDKGTWREQTTNCSIVGCSLYELRPLNSKAAKLAKEKKIANLSQEQLVKYRKHQKAVAERFSKV